MEIVGKVMGLLRPMSGEKVMDVARIYHDVGAVYAGEGGVTPSIAQYLATAEDAGVPVEVLRTIWQLETRQLALLDGKPLIRIEGGKWVKFGGDKRELPKPLNPGGDTPASTITGQRIRHENFAKLADIDPVRAIMSSSHGGPQIMGWWAERCGFKDERAFWMAQAQGPAMQLVGMSRFIRHPKNEPLRRAMQAKDPDAIAFHWNGPGYRANDYHTKVAAGLRKFA